MRVNRVNNIFLTNKQHIQNNKNTINPIQERVQNPEKFFSIYMGKDLISFGKQFSETLKDNYFHLPLGCSPDAFQIEAGKALNDNKNVIVEAPTGTGKTAVAHYIVSKNMEEGKTTFYTTPLKALSNQKLKEFREVYGEENVGILTGDRRENVNAPIIIMTTEVYRNMALSRKYGEKADLMNNLGAVIFDECHYMGDISRGATWEEAIMYTPDNVQKLALSATIGNAKDIQNWMSSLTDKPVSLISIPSSERHVPLQFDSLETSAYKSESKMVERAIKQNGNVETNTDARLAAKVSLGDFKDAVNTLQYRQQLPAIFFIFSRKFSRELLEYLEAEGPVLTTKDEQKEIEKIVNKYENKKYIGNDLNLDALKNGYAVHNAGIIPAQKELIEELFQKKLIKVVLATETLAAGINMPAKTVVMSSVNKPTDSNEEEISVRTLTPNEFKQMSGRAGRRGIDTVGYVYTMPTDMASEQEFIMLEVMDSNPLESRYNPDYAFLTGYYKYNPNPQGLNDIFSKTFYSYNRNPQETQKKTDELLQASTNKTKVLKERGFLLENEQGYQVTQKGEMASTVRGYDALTLTEAVSSGKFKNITPEVLAMTMGAIANPANPKQPAIAMESDLSFLFDVAEDNVNTLHQNLISSINRKLSHFGKKLDSFGSLEEASAFVKGLEIPDGVSLEEAKTKLDELFAKRSKIYKIQKTTGKYTADELVKAIQRGETVPTRVLEQHLSEVENYKKRMNSRDIDTYIEKLQASLESLDTKDKGKKAKSRIELKQAEIQKQIETAKAMKFLEENIYSVLNDNHNFLKKNSPQQIKYDYEKQDNLYARMTLKQSLIEEIEGLRQLETYNTAASDNQANKGFANKVMHELIRKQSEVFETERKNGIINNPDRYSKIAAQILYTWAYLNKINTSSMTNWEQLLRTIPEEDADEGTIYRIILQTSDLLSQVSDIARTGEKTAQDEEEINYYKELAKTAQEARKLIIKEPIEV